MNEKVYRITKIKGDGLLIFLFDLFKFLTFSFLLSNNI